MAGVAFSAVVLAAVVTVCAAQSARHEAEYKPPVYNIVETIKKNSTLSEFARLLDTEGLHRAFLDRPVTVLAPTNDALAVFRGRRSEHLVLNHMMNLAVPSAQLNGKLTSLVTGNPPLWISRERGNVFVNQAKIITRDISARSSQGDEQTLHIIDSVLEPLAPIAVRDAEYFINLDAKKLLERSTLYELGGNRLRVFSSQSRINERTYMLGVPGTHTFFMPVDSAFDEPEVSTGYDHQRNRLKQGASAARTGASFSAGSGRIRKEAVDARVIEGHIIPDQLLFTCKAPSGEHPSVAWLPDGIQVNVSLQRTSLQITDDLSISVQHNKQHLHDIRGYDGTFHRHEVDSVVVRSNTIVGDRLHNKGMVVARIVRANIPVQNGVVHLIDKPLMVVARTLYEYIMEEGQTPGNRLSKFARLLRDKGGLFAQALLEAKEGTLLAPSNEALEKVDSERLEYIMGRDYLRAELFGLHFVRDTLLSTSYDIRPGGDKMFSTPASLAANRVFFHYSPNNGLMSVEGRGVNATMQETDIGTINGVVHVIDRVLGVPYRTCADKMQSDPSLTHFSSLLKQMHMDALFDENARRSSRRFTMVVPTNTAWEKAQLDFSKAYATIVEGQFPAYARSVLERHFLIGDRPLIFEELVEMTRKNPRRIVPFAASELTFTQTGEFELNAYKDNFVMWNGVSAKAIRPNVECTNGIIHVVDTVFLDDSPPWVVGQAAASVSSAASAVAAAVVIVAAMARRH